MNTTNRLAILFSLAALLSCQGGGGSSGDKKEEIIVEETTKITGSLIDSAVSGVSFQTSGGSQGLTNNLGTFQYKNNETITFKIGDIKLGTVVGEEIITPVELAGALNTANKTVINISRLLQTLDNDNNLNNGIEITDSVRKQLMQADLSVSKSIEEFSFDTSNEFNRLGLEVDLVSAKKALDHLHRSLAEVGKSDLMGTDQEIISLIPGWITENGVNNGGVIGNSNCLFANQEIENGEIVIAYETSSVPFDQSCIFQERLCNNGGLSGSFSFSQCMVAEPANCEWGGELISSGSSVVAYSQAEAPFGQSCIFENRICSNGILSGSYEYVDCRIDSAQSCTFQGEEILNGEIVLAYESASVPTTENCLSQNRVCSNGILSGNYEFGSCTVEEPPPSQITTVQSSLEVENLYNLQSGTFTVSENATSFVFSSFGGAGTPRIVNLRNPNGRDELAFLESKATEITNLEAYGYDNFLVPMRPDSLPSPGVWTYTVKNANSLQLSMREDSSKPMTSHLRIQPYLTTNNPTELQDALNKVKSIFLKNDIQVTIENPVNLSTQYAVLSTSLSDSDTTYVLEQGRSDAVNIFFIEDFRFSGGTLGIAAGIPGSLGIRSKFNGVLVSLGSHLGGSFYNQSLDTQLLAETIVHEAGHLLGLWHLTESSGRDFDPLDDTPECPAAQNDLNLDGKVSAEECSQRGANNIMFWTSWSGGNQDSFTDDQKFILNHSPIAFQDHQTSSSNGEISLSYDPSLAATVTSNASEVSGIRDYLENNSSCQISNLTQSIDLVVAQGCKEFRQRHYRPQFLPQNLDGISTVAEYVNSVNQNDRFSYYFDPSSFEQTTQSLSGDRSYIGFRSKVSNESSVIDDTNPFLIEVVYPYTRAWLDGLQAGDQIVSINGTNLNGLTAEAIREMLPKEEEEEVSITLNRQDFITTIQTASETHISKRVGHSNQIAYINVREYTTVTADRVSQDFNNLITEGGYPTAIILDLRQNGGGSLLGALNLTDFFAPEIMNGQTMFSIKDQASNTSYSYGMSSSNAGNYYENNFVILVDNRSASASELTAAILKESGVATILGGQTYGKGVGQSVVELLDESGVFITSFELLSSQGHSWHEVGVAPDLLLDPSIPTTSTHDVVLQAAIQFIESGELTTSISRARIFSSQEMQSPPISYSIPWEGGTRNGLN